jgi:hypothetical protein
MLHLDVVAGRVDEVDTALGALSDPMTVVVQVAPGCRWVRTPQREEAREHDRLPVDQAELAGVRLDQPDHREG